MLSKRHNDPLRWKHALETSDCLPGITADEKDALWNRLHNRLQRNSVTKKAAWYWIAAAMLPFIIIMFTVRNTEKNELLMHTQIKENPVHATPAILLPASKESVTVFVAAPAEKGNFAPPVKLKTAAKISFDTTKAAEIPGSILSLPEKTETISLISNNTSVDTFAATAVSKKKLPVVHINDLETLPEGFTAPVNYAQNLSGKARKNKANNFTITSQPNSIGFKIKLSSKN